MADQHIEWSDCDAFARHLSDDGRETVVICDLGRHSPPGDSSEWHHDPELEITWKFVEDWCSEED